MAQNSKEFYTVSKLESGMVQRILQIILDRFFQGNAAQMASALGVRKKELIFVLAHVGVRRGAVIFERCATYCLQNGICLDDVLEAIRDTTG